VGRRSAAVLLILGLTLIQTAKAHAEKRKSQSPRKAPRISRLATQTRHTRLDCSHFVNYVYGKARLPYRYASSEELYEGTDSFQRVFDPMPGDLIVWKGHVGIVIDPNESRFVSVLRSGVKTDDYLSRYWQSRGQPRFLRYVGGAPTNVNRKLAKSVVASYASGE
jgi:cell wall-associated NlpC family hydrolase